MEWQPIETAPKDGTRVLIFSVDEVVVAHYEGDMWCENEYDNLWHNPTHWMPLPEPPTT